MSFAYPGRDAGLRRPRPHDRRRSVAGHRRRQRRRQDHAGQAAGPPVRPDRRAHHRRRHRRSPTSTRRRGSAGCRRSSRTSPATNSPPPTTSSFGNPDFARRPRPPRRGRASGPGATELVDEPARSVGTRCCRASSRTAPTCPAGSGSGWRSARALFAVDAGAGVLILDEPTASLDVRAEAELYDRFLELTAGLTTLVISHRFSTVRRADRIVVIEHGQVVEDGSHDELLARGRPLRPHVPSPGGALHRCRREPPVDAERVESCQNQRLRGLRAVARSPLSRPTRCAPRSTCRCRSSSRRRHGRWLALSVRNLFNAVVAHDIDAACGTRGR